MSTRRPPKIPPDKFYQIVSWQYVYLKFQPAVSQKNTALMNSIKAVMRGTRGVLSYWGFEPQTL